MEQDFQHQVFFECRSFLSGQKKKKIENYFRVRRRSGGGDCGLLTTAAENVYRIAFRNQEDQQEVLKRSRHVVEFSDGPLRFRVTDGLPTPPSLNTNTTAPVENSQSIPDSAAPSSDETYEPHLDESSTSDLKECFDAEDQLENELISTSCSDQLQEAEEKEEKEDDDDDEEEALVRRSALSDEVLDHCEESPCRNVEQQVRDDQTSMTDITTEEHCQMNTDMLDVGGESHVIENQYLSLSEGNPAVACYSLRDGLQVVLCHGDITTLTADALVSSANEDLKHSEGVAAALSQAGGPEVQCQSDELIKYKGKIPTGDVVVTTGGSLRCRRLLHAVGPVGATADGREKMLLERTIRRVLNLAELMKFKSIAMPCISSGVFGVPVTVCSEAIVTVVKEFGSQGGRSLSRIVLVDEEREVVRALQEACDRLLLGESTRNPTESGDPAEQVSQLESTDPDASRGAAADVPNGVVNVEIVQGTIETQQVDALVSPMVGHDPLSTRIGNALRKMVGSPLAKRFRQESRVESELGESVLMEGLHGLPSNAVFFLNLAPWNEDENGTPVQVLRMGINSILTSCENKGLRSVALPVLGAGIALRFPDHVVARVLLEEIHDFEQNRTNSTPMLVRIVVYPNDEEMLEAFRSVQEDLKCRGFTINVQHQDPNQEPIPKRVILLGKTGSGKSHLANTMLGENVFTAFHSPNSGTQEIQAETKCVNGRSLTLIDTPGFFDTERPEAELRPEILRCITECAPGPHAFLIVLKVDKFTDQEQQVITKICEYFTADALNYAVIVFTHGEDLQEGMTIEEFVSQNKKLSDLVKACGGRCHVFDNKRWSDSQQKGYRSNQVQLEALLRTIDKMVIENNGSHYTNDVLQHVEEKIVMYEEHIRELPGYSSPKEIREQAKAIVFNEFWIQLAGTATGTLLGAFFGVAGLVEAVLKVVKNPSEIMNVMKKLKALTPVAPAALAGGGEVALATGVMVGVTTAAAAVVGGVIGGVIGHGNAKGAATPREAAEKAFEAVKKKKNTFKIL